MIDNVEEIIEEEYFISLLCTVSSSLDIDKRVHLSSLFKFVLNMAIVAIYV